MNSVLLWIGGLLVLVLGALFAVPHFVNWSLYRGTFEEEASRALGREVRVSGPVTLRVLPVPYLTFEKVRISEPPAPETAGALPAPSEPILRADRFTVSLGVSGLLRGAIEASDVELTRPEVRLRISGDGSGNWRSVQLPAAGVLAIGDIRLDTVRLVDGRLTIEGPDGRDLARLDAVTGELKSAGGPGLYRFRGDVTWNGDQRDVRLSTADAEAGAFRLKAVVRAPASGTSYIYDGRISGLDGALRYDGELSAQLPASFSSAVPAPRDGASGFDLKSRIEGDASRLEMRDIVLMFEREGRPQSIAGSATATWTSGLDVRAALASKWLDLDRIAGTQGGVRPVDVASWLAGTVMSLVPAEGRFWSSLAVESVSLGGDVANDVGLAVDAHNGALTLTELKAAMPGGGRLLMTGKSARDGRRLDGELKLSAASAQRLLAWAGRGFDLPALPADGSVLVVSRFALTPTRVELRSTTAEIAGQNLEGELLFDWSGRPTASLSVAARQLDVSDLLPGVLSAGGVAAALRLAGDQAPPPSQPAASGPRGPAELARWFDPAKADLTLRLDVGRLNDGTTRLSDLRLAATTAGGALILDSLEATTSGGGRLAATGRIQAVASEPKGTLAGDLVAETPTALREVMRLLGTGDLAGSADAELAALLPLRLSLTASLGQGAGRAVEVTVDGAIRASRTRLNIRTDRPLADWASSSLVASAEVNGAEAGRIARLLLAGRDRATGLAAGGGDDHLSVHVAGEPRRGMRGLVSLSNERTVMSFDGRIVTEATGVREVDGLLAVRAAEIVEPLSWLGLGSGKPTAARLPVNGVAGVRLDGERLRFDLVNVSVDGDPVSGWLAIDLRTSGDGARRIDGDIALDDLRTSDVIAALVGATAAPGSTAAAGDRAGVSPWPDTPFDRGAFDRAVGTVKVRAGKLIVDDKLFLSDARLTVEMKPGEIAVRELSGAALGSRFELGFSLVPRPGEVELAGTARLADGKLDALKGAGARGPVAFDIAFSGRGSSPRSLVRQLTGKGEVALGRLSIPGLERSAPRLTAETAMRRDTPPDQSETLVALARALSAGRLEIEPAKLALDVADGVLKVATLRSQTAAGVLESRTTVDLVSLVADSEWRIGAGGSAGGQRRRDGWPGVVVTYTGHAATVAATPGSLIADELLREISIRRMERDAEELERLRRLDEDRARAEADRRRALEAAQAAAAAAAAQGPASGQTLPSPAGAAQAPAAPPSPAPLPQLIVPPAPASGSWRSVPQPASPATRQPGGEPATRPPILPGRSGLTTTDDPRRTPPPVTPRPVAPPRTLQQQLKEGR